MKLRRIRRRGARLAGARRARRRRRVTPDRDLAERVRDELQRVPRAAAQHDRAGRLRRHRPVRPALHRPVNPGAHQGTVGEEEFLRIVIGIPASELAAFCAQFS